MQAPLARLGLDGAKKRLTIHCFNSQDTGVDWREVPFKSKRTWGGLEESLFRSHKQHPRRDLTVAPLPSLLLLLPKPKKKIHQFQIYNTCTSKTVKPLILWALKFFSFHATTCGSQGKGRIQDKDVWPPGWGYQLLMTDLGSCPTYYSQLSPS